MDSGFLSAGSYRQMPGHALLDFLKAEAAVFERTGSFPLKSLRKRRSAISSVTTIRQLLKKEKGLPGGERQLRKYWMEEISEKRKVSCPCCSQRLFDLDPDTEGIIGIKCPRCRAVIAIKIHKRQIYARTEQLKNWLPSHGSIMRYQIAGVIQRPQFDGQTG